MAVRGGPAMNIGMRINADFREVVSKKTMKQYKKKMRMSTKTALNAAKRKAKKDLIAAAERTMNITVNPKRDVSADFNAKSRPMGMRAIFALHFDRKKINIGRTRGSSQTKTGVRFTTFSAAKERKSAFKIKKFGGKVFKRVSKTKRNAIAPQSLRIRINDSDLEKVYRESFNDFWKRMKRALARIERTYGRGTLSFGGKQKLKGLSTFPGG